MGLYNRIKREHVFIFLLLLCSLIIFDYFGTNYSGLAVRQKENCVTYGGVCCDIGEGRGDRFFSVDDSCGGKECWAECGVSEKVSYAASPLTGLSIVDTVNSGWGWFKGLFVKESVGNVQPVADTWTTLREYRITQPNLPVIEKVMKNSGAALMDRYVFYPTSLDDAETLRIKINGYLAKGMWSSMSGYEGHDYRYLSNKYPIYFKPVFAKVTIDSKGAIVGTPEIIYQFDRKITVNGATEFLVDATITKELRDLMKQDPSQNVNQPLVQYTLYIYGDTDSAYYIRILNSWSLEKSVSATTSNVLGKIAMKESMVNVHTTGKTGDAWNWIVDSDCTTGKTDDIAKILAYCQKFYPTATDFRPTSVTSATNPFQNKDCKAVYNVLADKEYACVGTAITNTCNDGVLDSSEKCDITSARRLGFDNIGCSNFKDSNNNNFNGGTLGCSSDCKTYDNSGCTYTAVAPNLVEVGRFAILSNTNLFIPYKSVTDSAWKTSTTIQSGAIGVPTDAGSPTLQLQVCNKLFSPLVSSVVSEISPIEQNKPFAKYDHTSTSGPGDHEYICKGTAPVVQQSTSYTCPPTGKDGGCVAKNKIYDANGGLVDAGLSTYRPLDITPPNVNYGCSSDKVCVECNSVNGYSFAGDGCYAKCDLRTSGKDYICATDISADGTGGGYLGADCLPTTNPFSALKSTKESRNTLYDTLTNVQDLYSGATYCSKRFGSTMKCYCVKCAPGFVPADSAAYHSIAGFAGGKKAYDSNNDLVCVPAGANPKVPCSTTSGFSWGCSVSGITTGQTLVVPPTGFTFDCPTTAPNCVSCSTSPEYIFSSNTKKCEPKTNVKTQCPTYGGVGGCSSLSTQTGQTLLSASTGLTYDCTTPTVNCVKCSTGYTFHPTNKKCELKVVSIEKPKRPDHTSLKAEKVGEVDGKLNIKIKWKFTQGDVGGSSSGAVVSTSTGVLGKVALLPYFVSTYSNDGGATWIKEPSPSAAKEFSCDMDYVNCDSLVVNYCKTKWAGTTSVTKLFSNAQQNLPTKPFQTPDGAGGYRVSLGYGNVYECLGAATSSGAVVAIDSITGKVIQDAGVERGFFGKIWDWFSGLFGGKKAVGVIPGAQTVKDSVTDGYCIYKVNDVSKKAVWTNNFALVGCMPIGALNTGGWPTTDTNFMATDVGVPKVTGVNEYCYRITTVKGGVESEPTAAICANVVQSSAAGITIYSPTTNQQVVTNNYVQVQAKVNMQGTLTVSAVNLNDAGTPAVLMEKVTNANYNYQTTGQEGANGVQHVKLNCGTGGVNNEIRVTATDGSASQSATVTVKCSYVAADTTPPEVTITGSESYVKARTLNMVVNVVDTQSNSGDVYTGVLTSKDKNNNPIETGKQLSLHLGTNTINDVQLYSSSNTNYQGQSVVKIEVTETGVAGSGIAETIINVDTVAPHTIFEARAIEGATGSGLTFEQGAIVTLKGDVDGTSQHGGSKVYINYQLPGQSGFSIHNAEEPLEFTISKTGNNVINYYSVDEAGNPETPTQTRTIVIQNANAPPIADIPSHSNGDSVPNDYGVIVIGRVTDVDNAPLIWAWKLDNAAKNSGSCAAGILTCGARMEIAANTLSVGSHIISLTGTDARGAKSTTEITLNVLDMNKPKASITRPVQGDFFEVNKPIEFVGIGDDTKDPSGNVVSYRWKIDGSNEPLGSCNSGVKYCENKLTKTFEADETGDHEIEFSITDSQGNVANSKINIIINDINSPSATILSPLMNAKYTTPNQNINFKGTGSDKAANGIDAGRIVSYSWALISNEGIRISLGSGSDITRATGTDIPEGYYSVELTVMDNDGNAGKAVSENLHVKSIYAPTATILTPRNEDVFYTSERISFSGTATDPDGDSIALWRWQSNRDGVLNDPVKWGVNYERETTDAQENAVRSAMYKFNIQAGALSLGRHQIKLLVVDSSQAAYEDTYIVYITVDPALAPNINITSPVADGMTATFNQGVQIDFKGIANDPNGAGGKICKYEWRTSEQTAPLARSPPGSGCIYGGSTTPLPTFATNQLTVGTHTITLWAEDSEGLNSHASIYVNVLQSVLRILSPPETTVSIEKGRSTEFRAVGGSGSYEWSMEGNCGTFNSGVQTVSGNDAVTYNAVAEGTGCKVVVSSGGSTVKKSVTVTRPALIGSGDIVPTLVKHDVYGYVIKLTWTETTVAGAYSYVIESRKGAEAWAPLGTPVLVSDVNEVYNYGTASCSSGKTQCLVDGTTYYYRMKVKDAAGADLTLWSTEVSKTMSYASFTEVCSTPLIDGNGNGILAGLDTNCPSLNNVKLDDKIDISDNDNKTNVGTSLNINCYFSIVNGAGAAVTESAFYTNAAQKCITANIGGVACTTRQDTSTQGSVRYNNCGVGTTVGARDIKCEISPLCNAMGLRSKLRTINVTEYGYCSNGNVGDLSIRSVTLDDSSYEQGSRMEIDVRVKNEDLNEDDVNTVVKAQIYNLNQDSKVVEVSMKKTVEYDATEEFNLNLTVPTDLDTDDTYKVYVKAYEDGRENSNCVQDKKDVGIDESDCDSSDDEVCDDEEDNDCDGDVDCEDSDCADDSFCFTPSGSCTDGDTQACGLDTGACQQGIRTCSAETWGSCVGSIGPALEACGDGIDNNCDGYIDCDDSSCSGDPLCFVDGGEDSDGDGLPDAWEMQYFGTLDYGPNDDPDGDGLINQQEYEQGLDPNSTAGGSSWWIWLVLSVVVIGVIVLLVVYLQSEKKKKKGGAATAYKPSASIGQKIYGGQAELKAYVKKALAKGFKRAQIEKVLLAKGWTRKDIDSAFTK